LYTHSAVIDTALPIIRDTKSERRLGDLSREPEIRFHGEPNCHDPASSPDGLRTPPDCRLATIIYSGKSPRIDAIPFQDAGAVGETQLGRMQFPIMQVLWDRGRASAREITDALNRTGPVGHSTVQTLLRQLETKGAVGHEAENRTFAFFPRLKEEKVKRTAAHELLARVFGGDVGSLVAHLLKSERLSPQELADLRRLIDEHHKD
jgi:BlaI family penicillinase repressor